MKYVIITNGVPGSGKTTFQEMCRQFLEAEQSAHYHNVSSIDYVKHIYGLLGWNGVKSDKARKDLSILKRMWISNCNGPLAQALDYVCRLSMDEDHVIFVDVREESEIIKYQEAFGAIKCILIKCVAVFISRNEVSGIEHGNKSDDNVGKNMSLYDYVINNDGTLDDLKAYAIDTISEIFNSTTEVQ